MRRKDKIHRNSTGRRHNVEVWKICRIVAGNLLGMCCRDECELPILGLPVF